MFSEYRHPLRQVCEFLIF